MWMLSQLGQLDLAKKGIALTPEQIYSPDKPCISNAIVHLGGGTSSFVSSEGLIITNHHVAYDAIQRASSVNSNYLVNGFLARTRSEEIPAKGYKAKIVVEMKDVTAEVIKAAAGEVNPVEKEKKIDQYISKITEAVKANNSDQEAEVVAMFEGKQYMWYKYKVFKDVRIVYAPPLSIGKFGGEIDNWMWPRHTGDFSFLRVYASADGTGAEYNEKNVPYKPKYWLKVAPGDAINDGEMNFIIGFPGFTTRYRTSNSVAWNLYLNFPFYIDTWSSMIDLSNELTKNDPDGKLKMAGLVTDYANGLKKYQGVVEGMKKTNFLQKKLEFEKDFLSWANASPERKAKYADIIAKEKKEYDIKAKTISRDNIDYLLQDFSGTLLQAANRIYYFAKEMEKPEKDRKPGITKSVIAEYADNLQNEYNNYYEPYDKAVVTKILKAADTLPNNQRITTLDEYIKTSGKTVENWVNDAFSATKLKNIEFAKSLLGKSSKEIEQTGDPIIKLAIAIYPVSEEADQINNDFGANVTALRKEYLSALYEWKGSAIYPDANSTIRFTYGSVKGYKPADAVWYYPFTTLQGVIDKNTGKEPFDVPKELIRLKKENDLGSWVDPSLKDVPVAFLNQCDITGGNSGSPVMNSKGEIIGLAFDGNYEAMISDWTYDAALQRTIAVDMRYVLFITEKFGKAEFLLDEMGVSRR
jgi:hypothetical protein